MRLDQQADMYEKPFPLSFMSVISTMHLDDALARCPCFLSFIEDRCQGERRLISHMSCSSNRRWPRAM